MGAALGQDETEPDDASQEIAGAPGFLKVVGVGAHDVQQGLVVGDQQVASVGNVAEMNETLVGDSFHPLQRQATAGVVEDDTGVGKVTLSLELTNIGR